MASESSLIVGDMDITRLTDEELYKHLTDFGVVVGPIVCTTRKTYERKLAVLMGASVPNYSFTDQNTSHNEPEEDADVQPSQAFIKLVNSSSSGPRRRKPQLESQPIVDEEEEENYYGEESVLDHGSPLYTPSPRRPLHSPDNSYSYRLQESYLSSPQSTKPSPSSPTAASVTRQPLYSKKDDSGEQSGGGMGQLLFKLLLVLLILVVTYLFFVGRSEKDAFASLEHLAQTAADAIEKDGAADSAPPPPPSGL